MKSLVQEQIACALAALVDSGELAADALPEVVVERSRGGEHGDFASPIALALARTLGRKPRDIAQRIAALLPADARIARVDVAGPGFLNFFLAPDALTRVVADVLAAADAYGRSTIGAGRRVQVEFVSANPTGPLHVGHGRGAAYGASLANVLEAAGFEVEREYYVNDAGRQMDILAVSTWLRYLELAGESPTFPPNAYQGEYVRAMARSLRDARGDAYLRPGSELLRELPDVAAEPEGHLDALIARARALLGDAYGEIHAYALGEQLADCRQDLTAFGVVFDRWFSERSLFESGRVAAAVARLAESGHVYEEGGARWFRSTQFGDEKDRVVQRENGQYTYFASDIAYHLDKFERGYDLVIDVWGADHHGYVSRVKGALDALGVSRERLTVALVQFAVLYRHGEKMAMSTRAGEFVTLRELRTEVGNDAARLFYVLRKSDQHLDFDLDLAKSQSNENPVYYIQYAHARVSSVHEQWGGDPATLAQADTSALTLDHERALMERLMAYPEAVEGAARELSPHLIAFYLRELAAEFHSYYNATRILADEEGVKLARLALATAVQHVLRNGLSLLGVSAPQKMVKIT